WLDCRCRRGRQRVRTGTAVPGGRGIVKRSRRRRQAAYPFYLRFPSIWFRRNPGKPTPIKSPSSPIYESGLWHVADGSDSAVIRGNSTPRGGRSLWSQSRSKRQTADRHGSPPTREWHTDWYFGNLHAF